MEEYIFVIGKEESSERIDKFLSEELEEASRSYLQKLLENGNITVNNKNVKANYKLREGDKITVIIPEPEALNIEPENNIKN